MSVMEIEVNKIPPDRIEKPPDLYEKEQDKYTVHVRAKACSQGGIPKFKLASQVY